MMTYLCLRSCTRLDLSLGASRRIAGGGVDTETTLQRESSQSMQPNNSLPLTHLLHGLLLRHALLWCWSLGRGGVGGPRHSAPGHVGVAIALGNVAVGRTVHRPTLPRSQGHGRREVALTLHGVHLHGVHLHLALEGDRREGRYVHG